MESARIMIVIILLLLYAWHFTVSADLIKTFAGTGFAGYSGDGGLATSATLNQPSGITIDSTSDV